jgi:predicted O-linked N-acetylglucosamine transferase (SPINDLY family)
MTSSLLINTGFPELVAYSTEEYIEKVVDLINIPDKLESYKTNIRGKFMELMEPEKFIQEYEELLLNTYNNHINQ